jgi:glucose 1-dehydrogenase
VAKLASACGSRAYTHAADVADEKQVVAMFERMREELGTIDILVPNAGIQKDAPFEQMTLDQWKPSARGQPDGPVPLLPRGR